MRHTTIELSGMTTGESLQCAECGVRFDRPGIDPCRLEPDGSLICPECRYFLLKQAYRRRRRKIRVLQQAFAEIKLALLDEIPDCREVILGICEAYRGKFDACFD